MPKKNNVNQNILEETKKIILPFFPDKGLGNISFLFQEKEIVEILGDPDEKEIIDYDEEMYSLAMYYKNKDINLYINYKNGVFTSLIIHVGDLLMNQIKLSSLQGRNEILNFIEITINLCQKKTITKLL